MRRQKQRKETKSEGNVVLSKEHVKRKYNNKITKKPKAAS